MIMIIVYVVASSKAFGCVSCNVDPTVGAEFMGGVHGNGRGFMEGGCGQGKE